MNIAGMAKSSLIDYPGLVCCVLFAPGCNYDCFYCHNRGLIDGSSSVMARADVMDFLKKRAGFLDAVTISGGEPTLQKDLSSFLLEVRSLGYRLKLDTNGSDPDTVLGLLNLCDYFAVDYKAPRARYREICGENARPEAVLETVRLLSEHKKAFEVRTTVIPQLTQDDLRTMARELPLLSRWVLNRYRAPERYKPCDKVRIFKRPYSQAQIDVFARSLLTVQPGVIVGG